MNALVNALPLALCGSLLFSVDAAAVTAEERLNKYCEVTSQHAQSERQTNLGPTGACGWVYINRIYIEAVEAGSPADGLLHQGDYLLGANGKDFPNVDPRIMLGNEIDQSEAVDGKLRLRVGHKGVERSVTLQLKAIGGRTATWPFDCKKSAVIRAQALRWLRDHQRPEGDFGSSVFSSFNGLFLLASPAAEDQEAARRCVYNRFDGEPSGEYLPAWGLGYSALLMSEYFLATGDSVVLPRLEFYAKTIAAGQTKSGSWTHGMSAEGVPGGYGELNIQAVVCFLSLVMMQECGVAVDEKVLAKATHFFGRYAGLGCIPYGDELPWDKSPSSASKDAVVAIAFRLLGDLEKARAFMDNTDLAYRLTEDAHTGAFFSAAWGPLCPRLSEDRQGLHRRLNEMAWYFELERRWDGGLACLPCPENLTGITGFDGGPMKVTGGLGLTYALPGKGLRILGGEPGPFSKKISPALKPATALFKAKKWEDFDAWMKTWKASDATPAVQDQAKQLVAKRAAMQAQITWTVAAVTQQAASAGLTRVDKAQAKARLAAAERLAGFAIAQAPLLRAQLDAIKEVSAPSPAQAGNKKPRDHAWKPLLPLAQNLEKDAAPKLWRVHAWTGDIKPFLDNGEPAGEAMKGWYLPEFKADSWQEKTAPFRAHNRSSDVPFEGQPASPVSHHVCMYQPRPLFNTLARLQFTVADITGITAARIVQQNCHQYLRTEFYLNGYRVAAILRPNTCQLSPEAVALLRKGANTLAVYITSCRGHLHDFDFGLEVARD